MSLEVHPNNKLDQPKQMSDKEKGFFLGAFVGGVISNLVWLILRIIL